MLVCSYPGVADIIIRGVPRDPQALLMGRLYNFRISKVMTFYNNTLLDLKNSNLMELLPAISEGYSRRAKEKKKI